MTIPCDFSTTWVIALVTVGLIIFDVAKAANKTGGDTISEVLLTWSLRHPVVPFLFGVLMGHLFWPQVLK